MCVDCRKTDFEKETARIARLTCECGNRKGSKSKRCGECDLKFRKKSRKFEVTAEELKKLVWTMPTVAIAKMFGVSDKAIDRRCHLLKIEKPPRGYWAKKKLSGKKKPEARKINISKQELQELAWRMSLRKVAEKLKVSVFLIRARCKEYGIEIPPSGYWNRKTR